MSKGDEREVMNYYDAREKMDAQGNPSGIWHYTAQNDDYVYPVGYCAQDCPGHATPEEAREHYRLYLLDTARYDGVSKDEQRKCEKCGEWTQGYVHIPLSMERHVLCDNHRNRETLDAVMHRVGQSMSS
jgi:hypothetical protein